MTARLLGVRNDGSSYGEAEVQAIRPLGRHDELMDEGHIPPCARTGGRHQEGKH